MYKAECGIRRNAGGKAQKQIRGGIGNAMAQEPAWIIRIRASSEFLQAKADFTVLYSDSKVPMER